VLKLGDAAVADAVGVESVRVEWSMGELLGARPAPARLAAKGVVVKVHKDPSSGLLVVLPLPPSEPETTSEPIEIPENLLPRDARGLALSLKDMRLEMPPGESGRAVFFQLDADGSVVREGDLLRIALDTVSGAEGTPLTRDRVEGALTISDCGLEMGLSSQINLDCMSGHTPVADKCRADGTMNIEARLRSNLNHLETSSIEATISSGGVLVSGSVVPKPIQTGPLRVSASVALGGEAGSFALATIKASIDADNGRLRVDASADADLARQTLQYEVSYSLDHSPTLTNVLSAFALPVPELRSHGRTGGRAGTADMSARDLSLEMACDAFDLDLGPLSLRIPDVALNFEGDVVGLDRTIPDSDIALTVTMSADASPWRVAAKVRTREGGAETDVDFQSRGFRLEQAAAFLPAGLEVSAEGSLDAELSARLDIPAKSLGSARVVIDSPKGLRVGAPRFLRVPLVVDPFNIRAASDVQAGVLCELEPFAINVGPFTMSSPGLRVMRGADGAISGGGGLEIGPLELRDVLAMLVEEFASLLPLPKAEIAEIGIEGLSVELDVAQPAGGDLTADLATKGSIRLNQGGLDFSADVALNATSGDWKASLEVPGFVEASWGLTLAKRLGIPELDAPMSISLRGEGNLDGRLGQAQWLVEAGPGQVRPSGFVGRWLARPLRLDRFAIGGRLERDMSLLNIDELQIRSGRATLAFKRVVLDSDSPLTALSGAKASASIAFSMRDWYLGDFLPSLTEEAVASMGLPGGDLSLLGLESFDFQAVFGMRGDEAGALAMTSVDGSNKAVFRIGEEAIPVTLDLSTGEGGIVLAKARVEGIRPDRLRVPMLGSLPFPISVVQLPVSIEVTASVGLSGPLGAPRVHCLIEAGPGRIDQCQYLATPLPVRQIRILTDLRMDKLAVEDFSLLADFDGPVFSIAQARVDSPRDAGGAWTGSFSASLKDFDLAWAWRLAPKDGLPAMLIEGGGPELLGTLREFSLQAAFEAAPGAFGPDNVKSFALNADLSGLRAKLPGLPAVHAESLRLFGDRERVTFEAKDAGLAFAFVRSLSAAVISPLEERREAVVDLDAGLDFAALGGDLDQWTARPAITDLDMVRGLRGRIDARLHATTPLRPDAGLGDLRADFEASMAGVTTTLPDERLRLGGVDGRMKGALIGEDVTLEADAVVGGLAVEKYLAGDIAVKMQGGQDRGVQHFAMDADFSGCNIALDQIGWFKAPGVPARVSMGAELREGGDGALGCDFTYSVRDLVVRTLDGGGSALYIPGSGGPLGGLREVELRKMQMGRSDIGAKIAVEGDAIRMTATSGNFDVPEIIAIAEPILVEINRALSAPKPAVAAAPDAVAPAAPAATKLTLPDPLLPFLPDITIEARAAHVQTGLVDGVDNLVFKAALVGGNPGAMELSADMDGGRASFLFGEAVDGKHPWSVHIDDLSILLRKLLSPLTALPPAEITAETAFGKYLAMPDIISGGTVDVRGDLALGAAPQIDMELGIKNLVLNQDVPLLSSIAALVNKRVILEIPFSSFVIKGISATPEAAHVGEGLIDGPINISIEKADVDLAAASLLFRGAVFGVCFEIAGPLSGPKFFLCENNSVIRGFTSEDEFEW
jgi:hypothetical protein